MPFMPPYIVKPSSCRGPTQDLSRLDQQMVVIGHQTVSVADPAIAADHASECAQKQLAVGIGEKYFLAGVAPARQMINRTGKL
jgi:hypothetical protein